MFGVLKEEIACFPMFPKHGCLLKCAETSCSLGAKRDSSPYPRV